MKLLSRLNGALVKFFRGSIALINIAICIIILTGALMRYVFKVDFYGMEELVLLISFWMYFMGSAVASFEGSQVSADLVSSALKSEKAKAVMVLLRTLITLALFAILMKWAFDYLLWSLDKRPTTPVYKIPMAIAHASLLVSFVFSVLYEAMHTVSAAVKLHQAFRPKRNEGIL
jgi:TRAP-type C4-dicarboxylate transport system permease small subunit